MIAEIQALLDKGKIDEAIEILQYIADKRPDDLISIKNLVINIYDENNAYQLHVLNEEMLASSGWTTLKENEFRKIEE